MATENFSLIKDFVDKEKTKRAVRAAYLEHLYDESGNPVEGIFKESMVRAEENEIYASEDNSRIVTLKNWFKNRVWFPKTVSKAVKHRKSDGEEVELGEFVNQLSSDLMEVHGVTHSYTISANGSVHWNPFNDANFVRSGLTPVGILEFATNDINVTVANARVINTDYGIYLGNKSNSAITKTFDYSVLYIRK